MQEWFEEEKVCFAPGCDEVAELALMTITDSLGGITIELCAKHSEIIMRIYYIARQRWAEERDKSRREAEERQEREALEAEERWLAYKAELKPKLLSAFDQGDDDNLREQWIDLTRNADRYWHLPPI